VKNADHAQREMLKATYYALKLAHPNYDTQGAQFMMKAVSLAAAAALVLSLMGTTLAQTRRPGGSDVKCNQLGSVAACVKCAIGRGFPPSQYEPYCGVKK
jgi:hypothetical protein